MTINVPTITDTLWPIKVSDLPLEKQETIYTHAREAYQNLVRLQFQLCYHGHISIEDLDNMTRYEYRMFYDELQAQKEAERKAMEESARNHKKPHIPRG